MKLSDFDVSGLDPKHTVVRCETQDEADAFLEYLCAKRVWREKDIKILKQHWNQHGSATCYHLSESRWCYDSWYEENMPELCIVNFCDILKDSDGDRDTGVNISYNVLFE